jgi:DNA-binding transcriptional LysR family regulator
MKAGKGAARNMKKHIRNVDLNLFVLFDALMQERHVSKAAEKVFLSQSAMSNALKRLRNLMDDPILVRTEKGMTPTDRALALEIPIREALKQFQRCLQHPDTFDPLHSSDTIVIYCTEYFECVVLPKLMAHLEKAAPRVSVVSEILAPELPEARLTSGEVSVVIGVEGFVSTPKRLTSIPLLKDSLVCMVRADNPKVGDRISLEAFSRATHLYHSTLGTPFTATLLDSWLREKGISRKFAFTTAGFMPAVLTISRTDYIMTLPLRLAEILAQTMPLRIIEPPDDFPEMQLKMIWHPLHEQIPSHKWLRSQLMELAGTLNDG